MALAVHGLQAAVFDMRIDLSGADAGVSQHFLKCSNIRTASQQVGRKAVS